MRRSSWSLAERLFGFNCIYCNRKVSINDYVCPHCGRTIQVDLSERSDDSDKQRADRERRRVP